MRKKRNIPAKSDDSTGLFDRVVTILEQARNNVIRSVNSLMVIAYWQIGREIGQDLQGGDERAEYGKRLIEKLSERLTGKYGKGFSATNLWYFRQFYLSFQDRSPEMLHPTGGEFVKTQKHYPLGGELEQKQKGHPLGSESPKGVRSNEQVTVQGVNAPDTKIAIFKGAKIRKRLHNNEWWFSVVMKTSKEKFLCY